MDCPDNLSPHQRGPPVTVPTTTTLVNVQPTTFRGLLYDAPCPYSTVLSPVLLELPEKVEITDTKVLTDEK